MFFNVITMEPFKSIAISSPEYETNNLRYLTVKSENIKGRGDISVFVPGDREYNDLPIVLLLHGVYASHWAWSHLGGVHLQMLDGIKTGIIKPMVLVMPSDGLWGDGSGYLKHHNQDFEAWIMRDVITAVIHSIKETSDKSPLFIAGLSMGGYGALRLGAKYGPMFKAVSGLSSITDTSQLQSLLDEDITEFLETNLSEQSVLDIILKNRDNLPHIRFDCGITDPFVFENRRLDEELTRNSIPHIYEESEGGHDWTYWSENIFRTLLFFNEKL